MTDPSPERPPQSPSARRLSRLVGLAQAAGFWERLWRGLVPPLSVIGVFLCVSWLGLWLEVPHWARAVGVGLVGLAFIASCWGLRHVAFPSRTAALQRIDRASGIAHRPASVLDDALASTSRDPGTAALWALHRRRAEAETQNLRAGRPSPRTAELDRFAVRAGVVVALIACAIVAGPQRYARVAAAFDFGASAPSGPGYRLDAWIDPPPYTGRPPILLDMTSDKVRDTHHPATIAAPDGSVVIIRASGGGPAEIETTGPLLPPPAKTKTDEAKTSDTKIAANARAAEKPAANPNETRLVLHGDSDLTLRHDGELRGTFKLVAIADKPPTIALFDVPKMNARGSMSLSYQVGDDYGVSHAEVVFSDPKIDGEPVNGVSLVPAPTAELALPSLTNGIGQGESTIDLSDHPWAGATVKMTLVARDEGGNEGRSEPVEITLPQKPFTNPLARALVEQRRNLVLSPGTRGNVGSALDALMVAPDLFGTTSSVYLGLRFAADGLAHAGSNKDLLEVADFLWGMAQYLENGDLTDAERALRQAEKELRDAIDRKASAEEIQKLTENLQTAMNKFLKELAQQQQKQDQQAQNQSKASKSISQRDLQKLIDRLKEQAKSGNREEAKKALDELQDLLENLKTAKQQKADPQARAMAEGLNQLDQMMRDQQDLRDQTFKKGQQGQEQAEDQQGQQGQSQQGQQPGGQQSQGSRQGRQSQSGPGQQGQGQMGGGDQSLSERQQDLRDRLAQIQKKLKQAGEGQGALDEAGKDMREAEDALRDGKGANGQAVDAQGRALQKLRDGAKKLADAMQQGEQGGEGNGQNDGSQASQQGQQSDSSDPLGRPRGGNNTLNSSSQFNPLGIPAAQRAQRVLEELRRRLADPLRSQEEIDYLERLLRSY